MYSTQKTNIDTNPVQTKYIISQIFSKLQKSNLQSEQCMSTSEYCWKHL